MEKSGSSLSKVGAIAALFVIVVCLIAYLVSKPLGQEGPFMMANTLFTGLAFVGVVWTVLMQREELIQQRKELELTREVFKGQSKTQNKQRFENSFFELISVHNDKVSRLRKPTEDGSIKKFIDAIGNETQRRKIRPKEYEPQFQNEMAGYEWAKGVRDLEFHDQIQPYLFNLVNILEYIERTELVDPDEKPFYYQIVKALLTTSEMEIVKLETHDRGSFERLNEIGFFRDKPILSPPKHYSPTLIK